MLAKPIERREEGRKERAGFIRRRKELFGAACILFALHFVRVNDH